MENKNIAFIGVGHMSQALVHGLLRERTLEGNKIILAGPHPDHFADLQKIYRCRVATENKKAVEEASVVFIGVRPKVVRQVIGEIKNYISADLLVISMAAGVTFKLLEKYFNKPDIKMVRIMPNIPVAYGIGVIGWIGNKNITKEYKKFIQGLLAPLGIVIPAKKEEDLEKISMIAGCGIGYTAYFMKNLEKVAVGFGFSEKEARLIVLQTFTGTVKHLQNTNGKAEKLASEVATKGGITEEVLTSLDRYNFYKLFKNSILKGYRKTGRITQELEKEFGNNK